MRSLAAAVRMDWIRVTTVRATAVLVTCMLALSLAVVLVLALSFRTEELDPEMAAVLITSGGALIPVPFLAVFMGVLGALTVGHDYRYGLVRPVLAAVPHRFAVVAGRMVVLGVVAVLAGAVTLALNTICALVVLHQLPIDPGVVRAGAGYVVLGVLWAWLAAGAAWLLRGSAAVLVLLFVLPLVIEPVVTGLGQLDATSVVAGPLVRWLPFAAGRALALTGGGAGNQLSPGEGGLVFAGLVLAVTLAGTARFAVRDA